MKCSRVLVLLCFLFAIVSSEVVSTDQQLMNEDHQEVANTIGNDKHRGGWGGGGWGGGGRGGGWGGGGRGGGWGGGGRGGWGGGGWGSMANVEEEIIPMNYGGGGCSYGCCRQWSGYGSYRRCTYCRCPTEAELGAKH